MYFFDNSFALKDRICKLFKAGKFAMHYLGDQGKVKWPIK